MRAELLEEFKELQARAARLGFRLILLDPPTNITTWELWCGEIEISSGDHRDYGVGYEFCDIASELSVAEFAVMMFKKKCKFSIVEFSKLFVVDKLIISRKKKK